MELDRVKCDKAIAFNQHVVRNMVARGLMPPGSTVPTFRCAPVEEVSAAQEATATAILPRLDQPRPEAGVWLWRRRRGAGAAYGRNVPTRFMAFLPSKILAIA